MLAVPLLGRDGEAIDKLDATRFGDADLSLLQHIVLFIASFVENALLDEKLRQAQEAVIQKLSRASRFKDQETYNHTVRVAHFTRYIAQTTELSAARVRLLFLASPMHDIGRSASPTPSSRRRGNSPPMRSPRSSATH